MKRKTAKILFWMILIFAVIGVVLLGKYGLKLPFAIAGTNTLSLSQAELQSTNPYLSGKIWLLTFSAGGLGQHYYGTITPSEVDAKSPSTTSTTTKNLQINIDYKDTKCIWNFQSAQKSMPIYYNIQIVPYRYTGFYGCGTTQDAQSKSGLGTVLFFGGGSGITLPYYNACVAIGTSNVYQTSTIPTGANIESEYTITLNVDGQIATKTINTLSGSTQGAIGDYAYASWAGSLVSGKDCGQFTNFNPLDYMALYSGSSYLNLISSNAYNQYLSSYTTLSTNIIGTKYGIDLSGSDYQRLINNVNSYSSQAIKSKSVSSLGTSQISNGQIYITTSTPIQFPVTTLYVKATTLGIYTPAPKITINSANSNCFSTGTQGNIQVELKNSGETGTFNLYAVCSSPFSSSGNIQGSLSAGQTNAFTLPITAYSSSKQTSTCIVNVETTGNSDSKTVDVCMNPQVVCTIPYPIQFCENNAIYQCSQDGGTKKLIQQCSFQQKCENGQCIGGGCNSDSDCISQFGTGYTCDNGVCKSAPNQIKECSSCLNWAKNLFRKQENDCKPAKLIDKWYLPNFIEKGFTQNSICPFYISFVGIFILIGLAVVFLIIKIAVEKRKR